MLRAENSEIIEWLLACGLAELVWWFLWLSVLVCLLHLKQQLQWFWFRVVGAGIIDFGWLRSISNPNRHVQAMASCLSHVGIGFAGCFGNNPSCHIFCFVFSLSVWLLWPRIDFANQLMWHVGLYDVYLTCLECICEASRDHGCWQ